MANTDERRIIATNCLVVPRELDHVARKNYIEANLNKTLIFDLGPSYKRHSYQVLHNGADMSMDDVALYCGADGFGYRLVKGNVIVVHLD